MPANTKYLSTTKQRILKISAAILGGYMVTALFHNFFGLYLEKYRVAIALTGAFSFVMMWVALMVFAFLSKNGWKIWGIYLLVSLILGGLIYLGK